MPKGYPSRQVSTEWDRMHVRMEAIEKRLHKVEDYVIEILQRLPRFERVGTVQDLDGATGAKRVREGQPEGESALGASVDLGGGKRSDTGGDGNTSSL